MAETIQEEIRRFIQAAGDARVCSYCDVAALTFLLYDTVLTFRQERRLMWKASNSPQKWLYFLMRYFNLISLAFIVSIDTNYEVKNHRSICFGAMWFKALAAPLVPTLTAEALIMLRLDALYNRNRRVRQFLAPLYIVRVVVGVYCCIKEASSVSVVAVTIDEPIPGCTGNGTPTVTFPNIVVTTTNVTVAVILLILTARKPFFEEDNFYMRRNSVHSDQPSFMHLFVRDGSIYLALVIMSEIAFIICMFGFKDRLLNMAGFPWVIAVYTIAATRIALNLQESLVLPYTNVPTEEMHLQLPRRSGQAVIFAKPSWADSAESEHALLAGGRGGHVKRSSAILD